MIDKFTVTYTNKDIMDKLEKIDGKLEGKATLQLVYGSYAFTFTAIIIYIIMVMLPASI